LVDNVGDIVDAPCGCTTPAENKGRMKVLPTKAHAERKKKKKNPGTSGNNTKTAWE